ADAGGRSPAVAGDVAEGRQRRPARHVAGWRGRPDPRAEELPGVLVHLRPARDDLGRAGGAVPLKTPRRPDAALHAGQLLEEHLRQGGELGLAAEPGEVVAQPEAELRILLVLLEQVEHADHDGADLGLHAHRDVLHLEDDPADLGRGVELLLHAGALSGVRAGFTDRSWSWPPSARTSTVS